MFINYKFTIKPPTVFYMLQEVPIAFTVMRSTKPTSLRVEAK